MGKSCPPRILITQSDRMYRAFIVSSIGLALLGGCGVSEQPLRSASGDPLKSWNDGEAKRAITEFVAAVTDPTAAGFVEPRERIAVFDNDGTLWAEQPLYFQLAYAIDRVQAMAPEHPEWQEKEPFRSILEDDQAWLSAADHAAILSVVSATHAGMTVDEFQATARDWIATARHERFGVLYSELIYQPMLELLAYLRANEFETYIVSGGGIEFLRTFAEETYGVPPEHVIGSSTKTRFEIRDGEPVLMKLPSIGSVNDKGEKPVNINLHIGRRPILAFGNSDGDLAMLQYTDFGSGSRLMLYLHHDDSEREWAYDRESSIGRLDEGLDQAARRGWTVVSIRNDFRKVFP